jgi:hypothetical protein
MLICLCLVKGLSARWLVIYDVKGVFVCVESGFLETVFQTFMCLFVIRKVGERKTLSNQIKIWLYFQE